MRSLSKSLIIIFSIVCYWFYLNVCFGFFIGKIFSEINKASFSEIIKFKKKSVFRYILKFFKNWIKRIGKKFLSLIKAINKVIKALKTCSKKFKSILKFKYNFRLLKALLPVFEDTFLTFCSLINEILFLQNMQNWVLKWIIFIRLLMNKSLFITRMVYFLYLILLSLFGIIIGFLLGVYKFKVNVHTRKDEINIFLLLFLSKIIYNSRFNNALLKYLHDLYLETNVVQPFSKFSFKSSREITTRPLKIIFKEPEQILSPFFIIEDPNPVIFVETEILWKKQINCKFQLFEFYQNVNERLKH